MLVVDDEANAREALVSLLEEEGYEVASAADGLEALGQLDRFDPEVVLTDLKMPRVDGLQLVERGKQLLPHAAFVVMTAFGTIDTAVAAIKRGAENYLTKPLDLEALAVLLARAMEKAKLSAEAAALRERLDQRYSFDQILGDHPSMQRLLKTVHQASKRKDGPFIRLNCAALAETLLESELFGHEKGSFTGALGRREGRFKQADGGTLFLDEVSEIPLPLQVKLLRFLQEREFERVGGNETLRVDVRIVAATNRDLKVLVENGRFREDLYYRLNVIQLDVPPLRARKSDIPILAMHFLRRFARENDRDVAGFTDDGMRALVSYPWPGNVRELENAIERAIVLATGERIGPEVVPSSTTTSGEGDDLKLVIPGVSLAEVERIVIERTLEAVGGSTARAAEILGISRRKIQYRLKEWSGVEHPEHDDLESD